ncbi:putative receptor-like protein kinase At1g80870 [Chenopodium quinoa]|uniref:non-specific serine/threonine protein kinase n=1 Tax=Chenopodium quinoa TaxID=63459 RepID=A0A803MAN4_CHEQI|nr:putative receptor-like protein kinase At1g80870 [Chenopodium quinoa]
MPSRPISPDQKPTANTRSKVVLLAITISAAAIFLMTVIYILYHLWDTFFRRSRTNPFDSAPTLKLQKFSYKELKSATNKFNPDNSIGKGGFGTVFRGILKDGKSVAIKKLDAASSLQAEREFQSELTILGSIRSPHIVSLLGYCIENNKRVLVYEYMPNRSVQDLLFSDVNVSLGCMNWERRFQIIQDVVRALEFLHNECDPPVIHGDIKPSNVLLDWDFKAKISDFGLSRVKVEDEVGIDLFSQELGKSQELWKSQDLSGNLNGETTPTIGTPPIEGHCSRGEVDFALALQASSSSKHVKGSHNTNGLNSANSLSYNCSSKANPKGKEVLVEDIVGSYDPEFSSVEHSKELGVDDAGEGKQWGKDWWWKQDDSSEVCSKDYVNEWIGTQICGSTNRDWESMSSPMEFNLGYSPQLDKLEEEKEELGCPDVKGFEPKDKSIQKNKPRKMQDWWKQEKLDELSKKGSKRKSLESKMRKRIRVPHFGLGRQFCIFNRRSSKEHNQENNSLKHEFSFKKVWKKKHSRSMGSELSGELFSRELSSTTSMRGTLCYIAPEYGGCGYLMEKGDIYSLGVLVLVIISGRRPLHVLNSPMEFEKANLISWCRHLAQVGNVLELVDERLKDAYNKEQVTLCINLALACLQRLPELRPEIGDIVKILGGEMDLPPLPFEFSPSPPSKFYSRSRRRQSE